MEKDKRLMEASWWESLTEGENGSCSDGLSKSLIQFSVDGWNCVPSLETHSSILAWRNPWTEEPGGLQSMGSQRVGHD